MLLSIMSNQSLIYDRLYEMKNVRPIDFSRFSMQIKGRHVSLTTTSSIHKTIWKQCCETKFNNVVKQNSLMGDRVFPIAPLNMFNIITLIADKIFSIV